MHAICSIFAGCGSSTNLAFTAFMIPLVSICACVLGVNANPCLCCLLPPADFLPFRGKRYLFQLGCPVPLSGGWETVTHLNRALPWFISLKPLCQGTQLSSVFRWEMEDPFPWLFVPQRDKEGPQPWLLHVSSIAKEVYRSCRLRVLPKSRHLFVLGITARA